PGIDSPRQSERAKPNSEPVAGVIGSERCSNEWGNRRSRDRNEPRAGTAAALRLPPGLAAAVGVEQRSPAGREDFAHARLALDRVPVAVGVGERGGIAP